MNNEYVTHLIAFLVGGLAGAAGQYLGSKYTDKRRNQEKKMKAYNTFIEIYSKMPDLFMEMKNDLLGDKTGLIREFVVLPNKAVIFNSAKNRFVYYGDEHGQLDDKIALINEQGFISNISTTNVPIFRMSQEFVDLLKALKQCS